VFSRSAAAAIGESSQKLVILTFSALAANSPRGRSRLAAVLHSFASFAFAITGIFLSWIILAVAFTGLGLLITRTLAPPSLTTDRMLSSFWLGFGGVIGILQLWHYAFAVTWRSFVFITMLGLAGIFLNRTAVRSWVNALQWRQGEVIAFTSLIVIGMWSADWASGRCTNFDTGSYHIPAVRWATTYPIIPGLANLHDRLGFNSSGLLYAAMIGIGPWAGKSNHLANGLLLFVLMIQVVLAAYRLMWSPCANIGPLVFDLLMIVPAVTLVVTGDISSLSTDVAPALVLLVVGSKLYGCLTGTGRSCDDQTYDLLLVVPLCCLAVCLKTTAAVFSSMSVVLACSLIWRGPPSAAKTRVVWCASALFGLGVPWLIRGIVLSGCPLYPSSVGCVEVQWRVPAELAEAEMAWVTTFARNSLAPSGQWFHPWLWAMLHGKNLFLFLLWVIVPIALALATSAMYFLALCKGSCYWRNTARGWILSVPVCAGILFWFFNLPSPRFGFYLFWMWAALAIAQSATVFALGSRIRFKPVLLASCALLASFPIILQRPSGWIDDNYGPIKGLVHSVIVLPSQRGGVYPIPTVKLNEFITDSGQKLYVPVDDNRCWDAPLPCTPHPAPNLLITTRFGRPEFVTRGKWQQINWPNPKSDFLQRFRAKD